MTLCTHFHIDGYEICQPMVTQHTGSLNKDTKKSRQSKRNRDENSFKYFDIFPPRTSALPFLNAKKQRRRRFNMH